MTRVLKVLAFLAALAVVGVWLFRQPDTTTRDGVVTISYAMAGTPQQLRQEERLLRIFEEQQPGIRVKLRAPSSGDFVHKLRTELAGHVAPDVFFVDVNIFYTLADKQVLRPLDDLIAADPSFRRDAYFEGIMDAYSYEGRQYGVPKDAASNVLFYNKAHFDAEGLPYPDETSTWEDILGAAKRLTKDTDGDGRIDRFGLANIDFLDLLEQYDAPILSEDRSRCVLNSPRAREACQFMYDAIYKHNVVPSTTQMAGFGVSGGATGGAGILDLFPSQKASMIVTNIVLSLKYSDTRFDWDVAMQPKAYRHGGLLNGAAYPMNMRTRHPKEAWELQKFLSGELVQTSRARDGESLPALKALANSEVWLEHPDNPRNFKAAVDQMLTAKAPPFHPRWQRVVREVQYMMQEFLAEERPVPIDKALADAERRINKVLSGGD
jgi:multiple sugar transport system substrate-binding protein